MGVNAHVWWAPGCWLWGRCPMLGGPALPLWSVFRARGGAANQSKQLDITQPTPDTASRRSAHATDTIECDRDTPESTHYSIICARPLCSDGPSSPPKETLAFPALRFFFAPSAPCLSSRSAATARHGRASRITLDQPRPQCHETSDFRLNPDPSHSPRHTPNRADPQKAPVVRKESVLVSPGLSAKLRSSRTT